MPLKGNHTSATWNGPTG